MPPADIRPSESFDSGLASLSRAAGVLLSHRGLKRWALLPLAANVLLYGLAIALIVWLVSGLDLEVTWEFWGPVGGWLSTGWNATSGVLRWVVLLPAVIFVTYFSFTAVGLVVTAPLCELLSVRVERAVTGRTKDDEADAPGGWASALGGMLGGMLDALRIVAAQLFWTVLVLPFLLVPVVGFVPLFVVTAWYSGFGFVDIAMSAHGLRLRHKRAGIRISRAAVFGLGVGIELLFLVPFVGLVVLPIGAAAGTLVHLGIDWDAAFTRAGLEAPPGFRPARAPDRAPS